MLLLKLCAQLFQVHFFEFPLLIFRLRLTLIQKVDLVQKLLLDIAWRDSVRKNDVEIDAAMISNT